MTVIDHSHGVPVYCNW